VLLGMLRHERDAVGDTNTSNTIYQARGDELSRRVELLSERSRSELQHDLVRLVAREHAHLALVDAVVQARRVHGDERPFGSLSKVSMSMLAAMAGDLSARIDGMALRAPSASEAAAAQSLLRAPMSGIAGGTTEIQKNTIARHILMLDERTEAR
jgi:alkylation response protein AidB-like acyl-CoA dehydrogenase